MTDSLVDALNSFVPDTLVEARRCLETYALPIDGIEPTCVELEKVCSRVWEDSTKRLTMYVGTVWMESALKEYHAKTKPIVDEFLALLSPKTTALFETCYRLRHDESAFASFIEELSLLDDRTYVDVWCRFVRSDDTLLIKAFHHEACDELMKRIWRTKND